MKKHINSIIFFLVIMTIIPSYSQDYFYTDFFKAKRKAKEENKHLFIDFSATWCGPCKMMEVNIFPDPKVKSYLTENYICVKLMEDKNKSLVQKYNIKGFPTFIILNSEGKEIHRWVGAAAKPQTFLRMFNEIPTENDIVEKYDSLYPYNKKNIDFLRKYHEILVENKYDDKALKIRNKILKYDDNWLKKENQELIILNINKNKYYKYILKHKQSFYDSFSIDYIDMQIFNRYSSKHIINDIRSNHINIHKLKKDFNKLFHPDNAEKFIHQYIFIALHDKKDPKLKQMYISSTIKYIQLEKFMMNSESFYSIVEKLIYSLKSKSEFIEMQKAFEHQFAENEEKIYLPYYDLKAFVEYMLHENEKYINTIKTANKISVKKTGKPYKSKLRQIIFAYKLINKDITPDSLK